MDVFAFALVINSSSTYGCYGCYFNVMNSTYGFGFVYGVVNDGYQTGFCVIDGCNPCVIWL